MKIWKEKTKNNLLKLLKNKKINYFILAGIPFILLDLITRTLSSKTELFSLFVFVPNLFTITWTYLIIAIIFSLNKKRGKTIYYLFFLIAFTSYLTNNVYYSMTGTFFDFHLLGLASEGSDYIIDTIFAANVWIYILGIVIFILFIFISKRIPYNKKNNYKVLLYIIINFILIHTFIPIFLGAGNNELTWNTWRNPRNVYENFNDNNKSMSITGLYEYTVRNFYFTYLKPKKTDNQTEKEFLNNIFSEVTVNNKNKYTGKFKGKNIIFLQLEGIDNWVLTKDIMPNTYALLNNSINFTNHYSYYNGGGSTFNSEFAVNTGYLTPITYTQNAYTFNKNVFPRSMPKIFKELGYRVNAFHMNTGEYYSRKINYSTWGYNNYYGLKDLNEYAKNDAYKMDTELIKNEFFYEKQFQEEGKFINYLITYSVHMPFSPEKGMCKQILKSQEDLEDKKELLKEDVSSYNLTEEDCVFIQAKETDEMVRLLMEALKENNLDKNTIIVAFTDHYLYTLSDQTILEKYKDTKTNLINKTPFFIWSKGLKKQTIKKVTAQINILPTVLNLMGVEYNPHYYTGEDALDPKYKGIVFFNDYSWYDGKYYVSDGNVIMGNKNNQEIIEEKSSYVDYLIKKNDLILKYNYLKDINKAQLEDLK